MIDELPGRITRRWALLRETWQSKVAQRPAPTYTLESLSADYVRRLADPALEWPRPLSSSGTKALVLIAPWLATPVPYFSMELGRILDSAGCEVVCLWDPENVFFNEPRPREIKAIEEALAVLARDIKIITLPSASREAGTEFEVELREILAENAVRFGGGESQASDARLSWEKNGAKIGAHLFRILDLLRRERPDFVVLPGGVFGVSGLFALACRSLEIAYSTYDCGPGEIVFAHDSAAAHLEDIGLLYDALRPEISAEEVISLVRQTDEILDRRRAGTDVFRLQPPSHQAKRGYDLFVPLNFRTDTAALQRQKLFADVQDWLAQLLEWVAAQPGVSIVIRQHPCERIPEYRGTDDWISFLKPFRRRFGPRLRFVSAWDQVNSYDLIAQARVALPYTSRTGIECAYLGVPTVLCSKCFYERADFVRAPGTSVGYFSAIRELLDARHPLDPSQRKNAAIFYALLETTALSPSLFTPSPEDYARWLRFSPAELLDRQSVGLIAECLRDRRSFPSLLYRRRTLASHN